MYVILVTFLDAMTKYMTKRKLRKERFILAYIIRVKEIQGNGSLAQLVIFHAVMEQRETNASAKLA